MNSVFVSVVVPCYRSELYIRPCVESLLNQSYPRNCYEVIVVGNQKNDGSARMARKYPGVTVLEEIKPGSYAARNTGVRAAKGSILAFTDSDCEVRPDWIAQVVEALSDRNTAVVQGGCRFASEKPWLSTLADYEWEKARHVFGGDDQSLYYAYTNNMATRREVYERCGPFLEIARGADTIFMSRAVEAYSCSAVRFVPEMMVRHLEIDRWFSWPQKMWTYGKSYNCYRRLSHARSLDFSMRLQILRETARRRGYSPARFAMFLLGGAGAGIGFEAASTFARLRSALFPPPREEAWKQAEP